MSARPFDPGRLRRLLGPAGPAASGERDGAQPPADRKGLRESARGGARPEGEAAPRRAERTADRARGDGASLPFVVEEEDFTSPPGPLERGLFGPDFEIGAAGDERTIFWDLETCGLADDPIFLLGTLRRRGPALCFSSFLARDPSGEPALLREAARLLAESPIWVTFNGRSFDLPRIRRRAARLGIEIPAPLEHHDLLLAVRRRWRGELPDCRLGTVERRLLGLDRGAGDVPGREVPERYRDFLRTGEEKWIRPVREHNRRDVAAMAVLHRRLMDLGDFVPPPAPLRF